MKFKKVIFILIVSVCCFCLALAQEYKTEQAVALDTDISVPKTPKLRINPYSDDDSKNHVLIQEVYFNRRVSPKNGVDFNRISYTITPRGSEIIVFYGEYDAMTECKYELFITEENVYKIKIPEFSWSGTALPKDIDGDSKDYIREDGKLIDGEYVLKIDLLRYTNDSKTETESLRDIQVYNIEIDTTPPAIDYKILFVCDDRFEDKYSRYIVPENHGKSEYDYMAKNWQIIGDCNSYTFSYELPCCLPVICVERFSEGDSITIIAEDELDNIAQKEVLVETRKLDLISTLPEEKSDLFDYFKAIKETLSPFGQTGQLDMAKAFSTEFQIPQNKQELIDSNYEKYPAYIVFSTASQSEVKIPIEYSGNILSFCLNGVNFIKNNYHIFVSDGADVSFFLGRKFIYDSDTRLKIKTLVGFDGRNYLAEPDILFPASCPSFLEYEEFVQENLQIIKSAVEIIKDNIEDVNYVEVLGYANPERSERGNKILMQENEDSLLPLSQNVLIMSNGLWN